jgi:hypothetical protein
MNQVINLNNKAVHLMQVGDGNNDGNAIAFLEQALRTIKGIVANDDAGSIRSSSPFKNQVVSSSSSSSSSSNVDFSCIHELCPLSSFQDDSYYIVNHAMTISEGLLLLLDEDVNNDDVDDLVAACSAIVTFNLALAFHRQAYYYCCLGDGRILIAKASKLYSLSHTLMSNIDCYAFTSFVIQLAILNNMIHLEGQQEQGQVSGRFEVLFERLSSMMMNNTGALSFVEPKIVLGLQTNIYFATNGNASAHHAPSA